MHHGNDFPPPEILKQLEQRREVLETREQDEKLGATGQFPDGKLGDGDEGEIRFAIAGDKENGLVHCDFGTPVQWFSMSPQQAVDIAQSLIHQARQVATEPIHVVLH